MADIQILVYETQGSFTDWIPPDLPQAIGWLQAMLERVPAKYRSRATIMIDAENFNDTAYPTITIQYWREETAAEIRAREKHNRNFLANQIRLLEKQIAQLKAEHNG